MDVTRCRLVEICQCFMGILVQGYYDMKTEQ